MGRGITTDTDVVFAGSFRFYLHILYLCAILKAEETSTLKTLGGLIMDRKAISQAVAKVIAYKQCGKPDAAHRWMLILIRLLDYEIDEVELVPKKQD